ncbi:MAG: hypothetical protein R3C45_10665 [Phycisphaerales bacterium]
MNSTSESHAKFPTGDFNNRCAYRRGPGKQQNRTQARFTATPSNRSNHACCCPRPAPSSWPGLPAENGGDGSAGFVLVDGDEFPLPSATQAISTAMGSMT